MWISLPPCPVSFHACFLLFAKTFVVVAPLSSFQKSSDICPVFAPSLSSHASSLQRLKVICFLFLCCICFMCFAGGTASTPPRFWAGSWTGSCWRTSSPFRKWSVLTPLGSFDLVFLSLLQSSNKGRMAGGAVLFVPQPGGFAPGASHFFDGQCLGAPCAGNHRNVPAQFTTRADGAIRDLLALRGLFSGGCFAFFLRLRLSHT